MNKTPKSQRIMKKTSSLMIYFLITIFTFVSCNTEELYVEPEQIEDEVVDKVEEEPNDGDGDGTVQVDTSLPCDFNLDNVQPNSTIIINCILDLGGQTINLPENVTFVYEGGDIINGQLNFGNGGKFDPIFLNSTLTIGGTVPAMKDPIFTFNPDRWGIVQGRTTSDIAQKNNDILESTMFLVKDLGITTLKIDKMDAYFEISKVTSTTTNQNFYPSIEAINIPSDFSLVMTKNTHLRTFPNDKADGRLIAFRDVSNSSIQGGNLHGDREEHDYSQLPAGEGGNHLMEIHGSDGIVVDGVKMSMGSKGGLFINALNFTFQPNYDPSYNIVVKNCVFEKNRRMAVALTDGHDIIFENNQFIDTALEMPNSDGGVVGFAFNVEPVRKRDEVTNELIYYERVYDVTFRNNMERGSRVGAFNIYIGDNVVVENNDFENKVSWSYPSNSKVRNNTFKASPTSKSSPAVSAGGTGNTVFNNEISGNEISGYDVAISAYHRSIKIFDNRVEDFNAGIQIKQATDLDIYNNTFTSLRSASRGIMTHVTWADNIDIYENIINVESDPVYFVGSNLDDEASNYTLTVRNNEFNSPKKLTFSRFRGLVFENNECNTGVQFIDTENINVKSNNVNTTNSHGISLSNTNKNVVIDSNTVSVLTNSNYQCIKDSSDSSSTVSVTSTQCAD